MQESVSEMQIPNHVAVIMDGNARWAKKEGVLKSSGHKAGAENAKRIAKHAKKLGIKYLTLYAFSSENWNRPKSEVKLLMNLIRKFLKDDINEIMDNGIRLRFIGDLSKLDDDIQKNIADVVEKSKHNDFNLIIALSYGSRDEIRRAAVNFANHCIELGKADYENRDDFDKHLDTYGIPDPDLFVRTSGEIRVSNFLLWQISYAELYFADVYWPDFNESELDKAVTSFAERNRRYGLR